MDLRLPLEIIEGEIVHYLDVQTLLRLSATCTQLRSSISEHPQWKQLYDKLMKVLQQHLCWGYHRHIRTGEVWMSPVQKLKLLVSTVETSYAQASRRFVKNAIVDGMIIPVTMACFTGIGLTSIWVAKKVLQMTYTDPTVMDAPLTNIIVACLLAYTTIGKVDDLVVRFNVGTIYIGIISMLHAQLAILYPKSAIRTGIEHFLVPFAFVVPTWIQRTVLANWSSQWWQNIRASMKSVCAFMGHWKRTPIFVRIK